MSDTGPAYHPRTGWDIQEYEIEVICLRSELDATKAVVEAARRNHELHGFHRPLDICPHCDLHVALANLDKVKSDE